MNDRIDSLSYLTYAVALTAAEIDLRDRLMEWLPESLIDAHAHCNLSDHVGELDQGVVRHMFSTFPAFRLEESLSVRSVFYPGKEVRSLRMPNAFRGIDHRAANSYLLSNSPPGDRVALYGIPDDIAYTVEMLQAYPVAGLKMYYAYFNPPAEKILQVFRPEILEAASSLGVPILLHLPKDLLRSGEELREIAEQFPQLTIVLAHMGIFKHPKPGLLAAYASFAEYPNVCLDTALVPSADIIRLALQTFGSERILFGSDEPLNLIRAKVYENPKLGDRLITEYPYHWVDPTEHSDFSHLARGATHSQWASLEAIRSALRGMSSREEEEVKNLIFRENARRIYKFD